MNINDITIKTPGSKGAGITRDPAGNMVRFWNDPRNKVLVRVGKFLETVANNKGESLATILVDADAKGKGLEGLTHLQFEGGIKLPLVPGFRIARSTFAEWCCPACHSAHGSGQGQSANGGPDLVAEGLEENEWFYRPADRALFTISKTCYKQYVLGLKGGKGPKGKEKVRPDYSSRIIEPSQYRPEKPKVIAEKKESPKVIPPTPEVPKESTTEPGTLASKLQEALA